MDKFPPELNGYVFKTKASHLDEGHRLWSGMERNGLCHETLSKTHLMKMTTTTQSIPARSSPGTRTAPSVLAIRLEVKSMRLMDHIPSELVQAGGEAMIDMFLIICNKIRQTGEWPIPWTQSLIITLPKKGNL